MSVRSAEGTVRSVQSSAQCGACAAPTILIVDGALAVATDIERSLTENGYRAVGCAGRADEAVAKADVLRPDLVLMDICLAGGTDGVAAAAAIRARSGTPIVFLSASCDLATLDRAKAVAPHGFVVKPCKDGELRCAVELALRRQQDEASLRGQVERECSARQQTELALRASDARVRSQAAALEALRGSEARLSRLIASAADAIVVVDEAHGVVIFNRGAEEVFGWTADEVRGQPLEVLIPERFRAAHREHVQRFAAGADPVRRMGERHQAIVGLRKDGGEFPADAAISRLEVDGARLLTVVLRDATDRQRAADAQRCLADAGAVLAASLDYEETLTNIATTATRGLADYCVVDVLDADDKVRRIAVVHRAPEQAEAAEVMRQSLPDVRRTSVVASVLATHEPVLMTGADYATLASVATDASHLEILDAMTPASLIIVPMLARGRCFGALTLIASRPAREYDEWHLGLAEELGRRAALAIDNARRYEATRQAVRTRDDVLGVVAHDLRSPLNAIRLSATYLQRELSAEGHSQVARNVTNSILRASARANHLVQDLLDIARIEAGRLALVREALHVAELFETSRDPLEPIASTAGVTLAVEAVAPEVLVWADRHRVLQLIDNVVGNALKYAGRGGRVALRAALDGDEVVFAVTDTGPGIPPENIPRLFERFWQAKSADMRGVGLGLAICKAVVDAHEGRIWVESKVGAGSTFFFALPAARPVTDCAR